MTPTSLSRMAPPQNELHSFLTKDPPSTGHICGPARVPIPADCMCMTKKEYVCLHHKNETNQVVAVWHYDACTFID